MSRISLKEKSDKNGIIRELNKSIQDMKKTKKGKDFSGIYEHTENTEPVATKEFVKQEIDSVKKGVNRLWQVFLAGFVIMGSLIIYLQSDIKQEMTHYFTELKAELRHIAEKINR